MLYMYFISKYINYYLKNCYLRTAIIFFEIFFQIKKYTNKNISIYYCFFNYI